MEENQPLTSEVIAETVLRGSIEEAQSAFIDAVEQSENITEITAAYERLLLALGAELQADLQEIDREMGDDLNPDTLSILRAEKQERINAYNETAVALAHIADDALEARGVLSNTTH